MHIPGTIFIDGVRAGTLSKYDLYPAGEVLSATITGTIARIWCSAGAKRATIRPAPYRGVPLSHFEGDIVAITPTSLTLANVRRIEPTKGRP